MDVRMLHSLTAEEVSGEAAKSRMTYHDQHSPFTLHMFLLKTQHDSLGRGASDLHLCSTSYNIQRPPKEVQVFSKSYASAQLFQGYANYRH